MSNVCIGERWDFYNENLKNAEDLDLWFRLYDKGFKFHNNQKYLVNSHPFFNPKFLNINLI